MVTGHGFGEQGASWGVGPKAGLFALWSSRLSVRGMRAAVSAHDEPMGEDGPPWVYRVPWEGN